MDMMRSRSGHQHNFILFASFNESIQGGRKHSNIRGAREVKIDDLPGGQMTPHRDTLSSPLSCTLEGLFDMTRRRSRAYHLPCVFASGTTEIQGQSQVCHARCQGLRTASRTIVTTLIVRQKNNFFVFAKIGGRGGKHPFTTPAPPINSSFNR